MEARRVADRSTILPFASFCAGVGMLDTGFSTAVRAAEPVLYLEREVAAAREAFESPVCGVADGLAARVDRLRAAGNGVVPLQAAVAAWILLSDAGLGWLCETQGLRVAR